MPRKPNHDPTGSHLADPAADMERATGDGPLAAQAYPRFRSPVRIGVISYRQRLADADGISAKAAIDGLVEAGVLADDSPQHVSEVWYRQERSEIEKTVLIIEDALG